MPYQLAPQQSMYPGSELTGVANLASLFLPQSGTSTTTGSTNSNTTGNTSNNGTTTTTEGVSQAGVAQLVDNILSGNQGLAATASGAKTAGLYNSSTNQLLINNLLAQTAGQAALLNKSSTTQTANSQQTNNNTAGTTNQNANTTQAARISPSTAAFGLAGLQLAGSKMGQAALGKLGINFGSSAAKTAAPAVAPIARTAASSPTGNTDLTNPSSNVTADSTPVIASNNTSGIDVNNPSAFTASPGIASTGDVQSVTGNSLGGTDFSSGLDTNLSSGDMFGSSNVDSSNFDSNLGGGVDWAPAPDVGSDWASTAANTFAGADGVDPSNFDLGGFFAEGGMVGDAARALVGSGAAEAAFNSGGDEKPATTGTQNSSTTSQDNKAVSTSGSSQSKQPYHNAAADLITYIRTKFAKGGMVSDPQLGNTSSTGTYAQSRPARMIMPVFAKGGYVNGKNLKSVMNAHSAKYATGGMVDLTNTGLRITDQNAVDPTGLAAAADDQSVASKAAKSITQGGNPSTSATVAGVTPAGTRSTNTSNILDKSDIDGGSSGISDGTTSGQVGTPSQNAAAVNGLGLAALGLATGVPGLGLAANALGITNTSMNPVSNLASFVAQSLGLGGSSSTGVGVAADGVTGQSSPSVSVDGVTTMGASTPANGINDAVNDAVASLGTNDGSSSAGNDGTGADGGGVGGTGNSAGDSTSGDGSGVGGVGDGGVGGDSATAATGGSMSGPGTSTSDSIPAWLSDGEYVLNADAVKAIGPDVLDQINSLFKPSPSKLAQGRAIHQQQFGSK